MSLRQFTLNVSLAAILQKVTQYMINMYSLKQELSISLLVDTQIQTSQTIPQTTQITELDKY